MPLIPTHFKGKAFPMTVITPVRRGWQRYGARLILFIFKHLPLGVVKQLAFIHFARWILVPGDRLPRLDSAQPVEDWPYDLYIFTTNFNGSWDQYIDAFGRIHAVSKGLNMLWYTSAGFPGPWPMRLFKQYIRYFEQPQDLYYNAYPGAAVRDIDQALALKPKLDAFLAETAEEMPAEVFSRKFQAFVNEAAPMMAHTGQNAGLRALTHGARPLEQG
jgi:hypothetical protein